MGLQARLKIFSKPDIVSDLTLSRFKYICVIESHGVPSRSFDTLQPVLPAFASGFGAAAFAFRRALNGGWLAES